MKFVNVDRTYAVVSAFAGGLAAGYYGGDLPLPAAAGAMLVALSLFYGLLSFRSPEEKPKS